MLYELLQQQTQNELTFALLLWLLKILQSGFSVPDQAVNLSNSVNLHYPWYELIWLIHRHLWVNISKAMFLKAKCFNMKDLETFLLGPNFTKCYSSYYIGLVFPKTVWRVGFLESKQSRFFHVPGNEQSNSSSHCQKWFFSSCDLSTLLWVYDPLAIWANSEEQVFFYTLFLPMLDNLGSIL